MMPIGFLMTEHRLIEKLVPAMRRAAAAARREGRFDPRFGDEAIDFIRTYADRLHHGKEEDILFRALDGKALSPAHRAMLNGLTEDHRRGRRAVAELGRAVEAAGAGDREALDAVAGGLEFLASFYPEHIRKEDREFFLPCMDYFDPEESAALIEAQGEYDRNFIHLLYRGRLGALVAPAGRDANESGWVRGRTPASNSLSAS